MFKCDIQYLKGCPVRDLWGNSALHEWNEKEHVWINYNPSNEHINFVADCMLGVKKFTLPERVPVKRSVKIELRKNYYLKPKIQTAIRGSIRRRESQAEQNRRIHFVIPQYESGWKVSLNGMAAPTGPSFLYTFAKSIGFGQYESAKCYDLGIHDEDRVISEIKSGDLICITTIISNYRNSLNFIKKAKRRGAIIAVGGPWASVRAKQIHQNHPEIDYVVTGEGEAPLHEILLDNTDKGIIRRCTTPITDLPALDFSGWSRGDLETYYRNFATMIQTGRFGPIPETIPVFAFYQSSRGCIQRPRCKFCGSRLGNELKFRTAKQFYDDVEGIIDQIGWLSPKIHIFDCSDSFVSSLDRFGGKFYSFPGVTFTVYGRADEMTAETANALRKLGVTKVSIGVESGSSVSLADMGKSTTIQQNLASLRILKDAGISVYVNLMYGLPGEKPENLERTIDHFVELSEVGDIYRVAGRVVTPLPNARWFFDLMRARPDLKTDSDCLDLPMLQSA